MRFKEERDQMERLIDLNVDKRLLLETEKNYKILQEKNKSLLGEVVHLRRDLDSKEVELEKS